MRILVLEDSLNWYETIQNFIERYAPGAEIDYEYTADANKALTLAQNDSIDVVFCDVNLERGGQDRKGLELCLKPLKKSGFSKPVIAMSSINWYKEDCEKAGASEFWEKGDKAHLADIIRKYVVQKV